MQQWHPDRWTRTPSLLSQAKRKFQQIQEAYSGKAFKEWFELHVEFCSSLKCVLIVVFLISFLVASVLSDEKKRVLYDIGLYDPDEEDDEVVNFLFSPFLFRGYFCCFL